ncbi:MAG: tRNA lysidine(34) synthetase TilS [Myxococcota bacterium]
MGRSRQDTPRERRPLRRIERSFDRALRELVPDGGRILVAVSGGRDSCVLLDLFRARQAVHALDLVVAHVHHGLRGADADRDAEHVASLARAAGLPFALARIDPESARRSGPSRSRPTLEEAARALRRDALGRIADERGCTAIATAHHAGDQAETLLLRLLRGTGPDGLAGMRPRSDDGRSIKPLLALSPASLERWAKARALAWHEDASNADARFERNRVRSELLPLLAARFNPRVLRALADLAEAAQTDRAWMEAEVEREARGRFTRRGDEIELAIDGWSALPDAIARRVVRRALVEVGLERDVSRAVLLRLLAHLRRGRRVGRDRVLQLPGGFVVERRGHAFVLRSATARVAEAEKASGERGC